MNMRTDQNPNHQSLPLLPEHFAPPGSAEAGARRTWRAHIPTHERAALAAPPYSLTP